MIHAAFKNSSPYHYCPAMPALQLVVSYDREDMHEISNFITSRPFSTTAVEEMTRDINQLDFSFQINVTYSLTFG